MARIWNSSGEWGHHSSPGPDPDHQELTHTGGPRTDLIFVSGKTVDIIIKPLPLINHSLITFQITGTAFHFTIVEYIMFKKEHGLVLKV